MATTTSTPEQRELSLVGKVEMRIALADSDAKLESTLKTYLAPLLLKLASEHGSVRNKVISICQHVNTRVKPVSIQLPVAALIKQFKEQDSSLIRHFDLLYIQQGVDRLSSREKEGLLPSLVNGISVMNAKTHEPQIFYLFLRMLEYIKLPPRDSKDDREMREKYGVSDEDARYLATWIGKFILFSPQKSSTQSCPGLDSEQYSFLSIQGKPEAWNPSSGGLNLLRTKALAARLLVSGLFTEKERFWPAFFASADPASTLSDVGDDMLKRTLPSVDLEDTEVVQRLFSLYLGEDQRPRVRPPLRMKILGLLNKSTTSTSFGGEIVRLVDDGVTSQDLDGEDVTMSNTQTTRTNIGREATKLRAAVFTYVNFVARYGRQETLHAIAPSVVARLRDFIEHQGWPRPGTNEDLVSRGYAYEVIGLLAKAGPKSILVESDMPTLDLLRWLFSSFAQDSSGSAIIVSIEEALSTVLSAMARLTLSAAEQRAVEDLLVEQMELSADLESNQRLRSTRYVAVRFANRCLPFNSVKARWVDVLGLGARNDRVEIREESERGLSPYWYRMLNGSLGGPGHERIVFPTFAATMSQCFPGLASNGDIEAMSVAKQALRAHNQTFTHVVAFARRLLYHEALSTASLQPALDNEWERRLDTAIENDPKARSAVKADLARRTHVQGRELHTLGSALFELVVSQSGSATEEHLVEYLAMSPLPLVQGLVPLAPHLISAIFSNNHITRVTAGQVFGILASHHAADSAPILAQSQQLLTTAKSWATAVGTQANQVHGSLVALGFYISRRCYRGSGPSDEDLPATFCGLLLEILSSSTRDELLKEGAVVALGQLCMFRSIKLDAEQLREVVGKVHAIAKNGNEPAILCIGQLSMLADEGDDDDDDSVLTYIEDHLYKLHEVRQTEVHFAVGESFTYLASGWQSAALATKLDIDGPFPAEPQRHRRLAKLTKRFVTDCGTTKPSLRKAAVMWLLCLVQYCGGLPSLQERLGDCQSAFKRCLTDRDELVQESASRGLGLVYEKGDRSLKDGLVRDLVSSFSSDRPSGLAGSVSAETQLFEPGALPTGDGSVSTYKDIMSLASEVGDSSLVYRFMSMASSNAIWSSRAAFGRFGLSDVLSDSSVDGYLADNPKLYPKLFRYRFDPNPGVQRSMNDIWNALVKDSSATVMQHFGPIMEDLLTSILGKEWRVRQASCAAIADLVQGRSLDIYEPYLERVWTSCFKVLDDIKESVRAAAGSLARTLTGVLTRALEADHSSNKTASAMLKHVLPFLLSPSGMESSAQEVQLFSLHTLLEIVKKSNGETLRPFIPELVERLIGLLSSLEPEAVNYVHLNASKYNLTEQKIDDMRLSSVRGSPIMEAIERCLDLLDDETMRLLQPRLENAMKSAVGLPSKVGASRVLVSLSTRRVAVFRPTADAFLRLLEKMVQDRNETVASSYAAAAGYVARSASDKQILRLVTYAKKLYFDSEGDREAATPRRSVSSGELISGVCKHASDRFNALAASILPFVYFGMHDPHATVKELFRNTWSDSVGGSRAVILYLQEILALAGDHLDSPQWTLKHTAARTVSDAALAACSVETDVSSKNAALLWPLLERALGGKTWDGKEVVLTAFVKFVQNSKPYYTSQPAVSAAILKVSADPQSRVPRHVLDRSIEARS